MKKAPDVPKPKEVCPIYCPFLKKEAHFCRLFDVPLLANSPLIYKCKQCQDSATRKTQYKLRVKDFEKRQYLWDKAIKRKPLDLWGKIKTSITDWKDRKEFKEFLSTLAGDIPMLLDKKTSKLLLNLYLVLDNSEKQELKNILSNSKSAEIFISKLMKMGRRDDLLKQVRREIDDLERQLDKEKETEEELLRRRFLLHSQNR